MKTEIDILSDREIEIRDYAESQSGTMEFITEKLAAEGDLLDKLFGRKVGIRDKVLIEN